MWYIIIAVVLIAIIILLTKHLLFNPILNAVISIIWFAFLGFGFAQMGAGIIVLPISIIIIDCVRDIVISKDYYESIEIEIDKRFLVKSLTAIFSLGFARIIFLLVVDPLLSHSVASEIKQQLRCEHPLPHSSFFSPSKAKNYYYAKQMGRLEKKGAVISNIQTVENETEIRRRKLSGLYPEKLLAKLSDIVAGDKDLKEKRKEAEGKLKSYKSYYAYLSTAVFEKYPPLISEAMSKKGCCPLASIKSFEELKALNLTLPLALNNSKDSEWSEYFIIQALRPLVFSGTFEDCDFNDKDVFDNHAYQYAKSAVRMPSIDADNDPLFALDDD